MRTLLGFCLAAVLALPATVAMAGTVCQGDADNNGIVDVDDLLLILADWGCTDCNSDTNDDGIIDVDDLLNVLADWGCEEPQGPTTTLSGFVTNLWTGGPIEGASVMVGSDALLTLADGSYTGDFAPGIYDILVEAENYLSYEDEIVLFPDVPAILNVALEPEAAVIVDVVVTGDAEPGATVQAMAVVQIFDGSTIESYAWTQTSGAAAGITGADTDTASVDLGDAGTYKDELLHALKEPPIGADDLPPNIPPPDGEFPGGLQDRFQVVAVYPFAREEGALVGLEVDVTTTSGTYAGDAEIHTHTPWGDATGLRDVPINRAVLLYGKEQLAYDWALVGPGGAALADETTQAPYFTPDTPGVYTVTVTDEATMSLVTLEIFAGNWRGIIVGQDADTNPISDPSCTGCHVALGADKFTPWSQTGHAEIFETNLNTSTHYGPSCFPCHTVGYDPDSMNSGIDEMPDYQAFLDSGLINNPGDNWTVVLDQYPWTAQMANIQCENCHGPQDQFSGQGSLAHGPVNPAGEPRVSISSDVCATCHGEPLRHGRFQQWQLSGHANYELAIDEGDSGNCSRCHTGNGFLTWLPILLGDEPGDPLDSITVTWEPDEVHPQTCVTCHDPHAIGTTTGANTNANVYIADDTPPLIAGFTAYGVGRGAICMTCHNTRRGLRNDDTYDGTDTARAPHGSAQADTLMGENAYLVQTGIRGGHSFVTDSCAGCHMVATPPPDQLSYNQGGTNHTFFAEIGICADCHGDAVDGEYLQEQLQGAMDALQTGIEDAIYALIDDLTLMGNTIDLNGEATITSASQILDIEFGETRGRQAITVTFTDMSVFGPYRMTDIDVIDPGLVVIGQLYDFADTGLIKAGWNWNLVNNDGSMGVHNPTFLYTVVTEAIIAVDPLASHDLETPFWMDPKWDSGIDKTADK